MNEQRRKEITDKVQALLAQEPDAETDLHYVFGVWDRETNKVGMVTTISCCPICMANVLDIIQRLHLLTLCGEGDAVAISELRERHEQAKRN